MQQNDGRSDRESGKVSEAVKDSLSKATLRRPSRSVPLVRCERFKWTDKRKGTGYRSTGWLVDWRDPNGRRLFSHAQVAFRGALEGRVRNRTLVQLKSTLSQFESFVQNPQLHEITTGDIERFLKSLRARDGDDVLRHTFCSAHVTSFGSFAET